MSDHTDPVGRFIEDESLTHSAWQRALREGHLLGQACSACGHHTAAPKAACVRCGERGLDPVALPTEGEVFAETTVTVPPEQFEGRYCVAIVDLGPGRVMARIDGDADIGDEVELVGTIEADKYPGPLFE